MIEIEQCRFCLIRITSLRLLCLTISISSVVGTKTITQPFEAISPRRAIESELSAGYSLRRLCPDSEKLNEYGVNLTIETSLPHTKTGAASSRPAL